MTRSRLLLLGLGLCAALLAGAAAPGAREAAGSRTPKGMVYVPGGYYTPLYKNALDTSRVAVRPYYLDAHPVTNAEFLAFVKANPRWRRSSVRSLFTDGGYLKHWTGDLAFGPDSLARRPVVNVSWFAAKAYASWRGKRLPTTAEWELAAAASTTLPDGQEDPEHNQRILDWYSRPGGGVPAEIGSTPRNYWGAADLHGLVWEWVMDFNSGLVTGESRNDGDLDAKLFCGSGSAGATNFRDYASFIRFAFRSGLDARYTVPSLGFRCAMDARPA